MEKPLTRKDMIEKATNLVASALAILETRGHDYGVNNFIDAAKVASVITGKAITGVEVAACIIGIKCARYGNLLNTPEGPKGEQIEDTVSDAINYFALMERERIRNGRRFSKEEITEAGQVETTTE